MHIKQVVIEGFRSYRNRTVVHPLDEKNNVFVGRNGTGKSNFFSAIAFVLSDEYSRLTEEQRHLLLNDGSGERQILSAYVEITFENEDGRLPVEGRRRDVSDVVIKREISPGKDMYYVNGKHRPQIQIKNLLEAAGFSRNNPYYIVKQGKVAQLSTASDAFRLRLLLDVAGAKTFDERMRESTTILEKDALHKQKAIGLVNELKDHLATLEDEKLELEAYQKLDKTKRSLEYGILEKESRLAQDKLQRYQEATVADELNTLADSLQEIRGQIEVMERKEKEERNRVQYYEDHIKSLKDRLRQAIERRSECQYLISDLRTKCEEEESARARRSNERKSVEEKIKETTATMEKRLEPQFTKLKREESELRERLSACEQEQAALLAKEGHRERFSSQRERDAWIGQELMKLRKMSDNLATQALELREDIQAKEKELAKKRRAKEECKASVTSVMSDFSAESKRRFEMKRDCDRLEAEKRRLWDEVKQKEHEFEQASRYLTELEEKHKSLMPKAVAQGLSSLNKILADHPNDGVYGPLIDFISASPAYFTPIDVAAGNKLFHVVVDKLDTALNIVNIMAENSRAYPGELTFLPLETVNPNAANFPNDPKATPLVEHVKTTHDAFAGVLRQVFGHVLLCQSIDDAIRLSRSSKSDRFTCVTVEGDLVRPKGPISGGYVQKERSRMKSVSLIADARKRQIVVQEDLAAAKEEFNRVDVEIRQKKATIAQFQTTLESYRATYERTKTKPVQLENEIKSLEKMLEDTTEMLLNTERKVNRNRESIRLLEEEKRSNFLGGLSPAERRRMDELVSDVQKLRQEVQRVMRERSRIEAERTELSQLLERNLEKRKQDLDMSLDDGQMDYDDWENNVRELEEEMQSKHDEEQTIGSLINAVEKKREEAEKETEAKQLALDDLKEVEDERVKRLNEERRKAEKRTARLLALQEKIRECSQKINALGSLPTEAYTSYQNVDLGTLQRDFQRCSAELKQTSGVNMRALDQYNKVVEELAARERDLEEANQELERIQTLMESLANEKDEKIEFTFKQVASHFEETFQKLTGGHGQLCLHQKDPTELSSTPTISGISTPSQRYADFLEGVGIQVSFSGRGADLREMQQLSGGQKTVVALAFIFSVQKCDPGPFYLFDEIDAFLDPHYRSAVADVIRTVSDEAQFITSTFHPEMIEVADKVFGVYSRNKVSSISEWDKEGALEFVSSEAQ